MRRPKRDEYHHLSSQQLHDAQRRLSLGIPLRTIASSLGLSQVQLNEALTLYNDERSSRFSRQLIGRIGHAVEAKQKPPLSEILSGLYP